MEELGAVKARIFYVYNVDIYDVYNRSIATGRS